MIDGFLTGSSFLFFGHPLYAEAKKKAEWRPGYVKLEEEGKPAQRLKQAYTMFERCHLCPRQCGVNRKKMKRGFARRRSNLWSPAFTAIGEIRQVGC